MMYDPMSEVYEELDDISEMLQEQQEAAVDNIINLCLKACKKLKKREKRIKAAGEYIDQSDTISAEDKENLKRILHID